VQGRVCARIRPGPRDIRSALSGLGLPGDGGKEGPRCLLLLYRFHPEHIASALDADLFRITAAEPYTDDILNYYDPSTRAYIERYDDSARPAIAGELPTLDDYDVIFVGYPIWYGRAPKIIRTFLESGSFSSKTVIPFCTSGSSSIDNNELRASAPDAL